MKDIIYDTINPFYFTQLMEDHSNSAVGAIGIHECTYWTNVIHWLIFNEKIRNFRVSRLFTVYKCSKNINQYKRYTYKVHFNKQMK